MTNRNPIPDDAVLVAIDIAKHKNVVLIERPGSSRRRKQATSGASVTTASF